VSKISKKKEKVRAKLKTSMSELAALERKQREIDVQLKNLLKEKVRYDALHNISSNLERLTVLGGAKLFWGESGDEQDTHSHLVRLHKLVTTFEGQLEGLKQERVKIWNTTQSTRDKINDYIGVTESLTAAEEAARDEFVIEREIEPLPYRAMAMPWTVHGEDENRFRKILLVVLIIAFLLGYLIPLWEKPVVEVEAKIEVPERLAKLLLEKKPPPPPPPPPKEEEPPEELPKKEEVKKEKKEEIEKKPEPKKKETRVARKKVESVGVLAFKNDFASLLDLDSDVDKKLGAEARLTNMGRTAKQSTRSIITTQAASGTGGINTAALSRNVGGAGNTIEGVGFARVESSIGTEYATEDRPLSEGPGPSRTDEEIQIVFDKYKAALYRIYNRELRKNPTLQGKMVLRLTIEPNGKVSACSVDSSDMESPSMDKNIVARVKKFNFGAKEGVPTITILFPIDFLPAN
jgi:TonB family protein